MKGPKDKRCNKSKDTRQPQGNRENVKRFKEWSKQLNRAPLKIQVQSRGKCKHR